MKSRNSVYALTLLLMVSIAGCANSTQGSKSGVQNINEDEFAKIVQAEKAIVVDVRTPQEVAAGIIKGATVFADINGSNFEAQVEKLDKSKTYIIYCRSGARSSSAANYMVSKGFTKVYNLNGGISNWKGEITTP